MLTKASRPHTSPRGSLFGSSTRGVFRSALEARLRERARLAIEVWVREGVADAPRDESAAAEAAGFIAGALTGAIEVWAFSDDADAAALRLSSLMPRWWPDPVTRP